MKPNLRAKKVVVVAASALVASLVEKELAAAGAAVVTYKNGFEGLAAIRHQEPDLVFFDRTAPLMSGDEVLKVLDAEGRTGRPPVIVLAESSDTEAVEELLKLGAVDFLMTDRFEPGEIAEKAAYRLQPSSAEKRSERTRPGSVDISSHTATTPAADDRAPRVCVIEDDPLLRNLLATKFERSNVRATFRSDGAQAVSLIREYGPDVIILDLMLPGRSGFDVLTDIRSDGELAQIPVIVLSNRSNTEDMDRARELGANTFFVKALTDLNDVVTTITELTKPGATT